MDNCASRVHLTHRNITLKNSVIVIHLNSLYNKRSKKSNSS